MVLPSLLMKPLQQHNQAKRRQNQVSIQWHITSSKSSIKPVLGELLCYSYFPERVSTSGFTERMKMLKRRELFRQLQTHTWMEVIQKCIKETSQLKKIQILIPLMTASRKKVWENLFYANEESDLGSFLFKREHLFLNDELRALHSEVSCVGIAISP